jgi:very-short-patch-repair endonuclease
MLLTKEVIISWMPIIREYYIKKGYVYTKPRDKFIVKVEDLTPNSNAMVEVKCDYCGKIYEKRYMNYYNQNILAQIKNDCCSDCLQIKAKESLIEKYNVDNSGKLEESQEKRKNTLIDKYGVDNPMKVDEVKEKLKETMNEKYGVDWFSQTDDFKIKTKETFLKNYGVENPTQNSLIRRKQIISLYKNNTAPTSKQQKFLHKVIGGEINFPFLNYLLDIAFPDEKIYIEYDGGGHDLQVKFGKLSFDEYKQKERKRWYALYRKGWKEIRVISSNDKVPSKIILLEMIKFAKDYLKNNRHYIKFNLDDETVITSQFETSYDFGKLKSLPR